MPELSPLTANIAVVALESLLYGVYGILASCAFYFMMARRRECLNGTPWFCHSSLFSPVALEALALFITVTIVRLCGFFFSFLIFSGYNIGFLLPPVSLWPSATGKMDPAPEYSILISLI